MHYTDAEIKKIHIARCGGERLQYVLNLRGARIFLNVGCWDILYTNGEVVKKLWSSSWYSASVRIRDKPIKAVIWEPFHFPRKQLFQETQVGQVGTATELEGSGLFYEAMIPRIVINYLPRIQSINWSQSNWLVLLCGSQGTIGCHGPSWCYQPMAHLAGATRYPTSSKAQGSQKCWCRQGINVGLRFFCTVVFH